MLPEVFLSRLKNQLGDEYDDYLRSLDRPRAVALRFNPLKTDIFPALPFVEEPVPWAAYGHYYAPDARPGLHVWHEAGLYYLQEASAMAPVTLLAPQPGELVLDLCAAPGGKTTQIAALMGGAGLLICNEINPKRAKILSRNIERMAVSNALVLNHHPRDLERHFTGCFDRVLVDAPCSGEGMFRKEEAAVTDWSEETVHMCAERQGQILATAARLLRPGGRLVYSTCTLLPEENAQQIERFLAAHPDFEPDGEMTTLLPGVDGWEGDGFFFSPLRRRG
jgi:16S rRNA C967 or C1407 C5-methylase (RsmB/RsmF family)